MDYLKFSIITPSFNQGQFIEDTIKSVLAQNYPNFEHIIIDGGSTDNTIEILKSYPHLCWISEKDNGQSDAINKGFKMATGDIIAWLNSDDYYDDDAFRVVNKYFLENSQCNFLHGNITLVDKDKNILHKSNSPCMSFKKILNNPDVVRQPSCFWKKTVLSSIGYINVNYHLAMDLDFFLRIGKINDFHYVKENLSFFRLYSEGKSSKYLNRQLVELIKILFKHGAAFNIRSYYYLLKKLKFLLIK